jgi:hypothetical protein
LQTLETRGEEIMKKGEMYFHPVKKYWKRDPAQAERSDLLFAAGILCFVAAILIFIYSRLI